MGTFFIAGSFKFVIFENDHPPAHCHILYGGMNLGRVLIEECVCESILLTPFEAEEVEDFVRSKKNYFMNHWEACHGKIKRRDR